LIEKRKNEKNNFFVFDIETNGLNPIPEKFLYAYVYNGSEYFYFDNISEIKKFMFQNTGIYFAHNAEYDLLGIFGNIFTKLDNKAIFNGSRFISCKYGKTKFYDSFNIFPYSLKNIGKSLGIEKKEIDYNLTNATHTGQITNENKEYCKNDCLIIYKALKKLFELTGIIKPTIASISINYFRAKYLKFNFEFNDFLCLKFFQSYYGGRCESFFIGKCHGFKYDINSLYPFIMKNVKIPNPLKLKESTKSQLNIKFLLSKLKYSGGQATIKVRHKKTHIGFLPLKYNNKLIFPSGEFTGTWIFNEILFAIQNNAIEIIEIYSIIYSDFFIENFFSDYINDNYNARLKSEGIYKDLYKLLMNNLYGKFSQRITTENEYFEKIPIDYINKLIIEGKKFNIITFNKTRSDCFIQLEKKQSEFTYNTIPIIGSYITALARLELLKYMLKHQSELLYVDTDSIFVTKELNYNSTVLGEFKKEPYIVTEIRGLKNYTQFSEKDLKIFDKIKGVSKNSTEIIKYKEYSKMSYYKSKGALRQNKQAGAIFEQTKILTGKYEKRNILQNGQTEILTINQ